VKSDWDRLSDSSKSMLRFVMRQLASDFSGQLTLECGQGGIRYITMEQRLQPKDVAANLTQGDSQQ
jgi:hypothetical protein